MLLLLKSFFKDFLVKANYSYPNKDFCYQINSFLSKS